MARRRAIRPTPEIQQRFVDGLTIMASIESIAGSLGISYQTFCDWMKKGKAATRGVYFEFHRAVLAADAQAEIDGLAYIYSMSLPQVVSRVTTTTVDSSGKETVTTKEKFSRGKWRARAWIMEYSHPETWSLKYPRKEDIFETKETANQPSREEMLKRLTPEQRAELERLEDKINSAVRDAGAGKKV
ncbi:MAG: hypothetical protein WAU82_07855 [Candidatus Binatus sp.]|uniref:hypothetical protein n=1 Tax=Candidatus Binatus sp. TaxID=2811406 RepID=UPI003BAE874D